MKNLKKIGVQELGTQEMLEIEGGSWVGDALRAVGRAAKAVGQAVASAAEWVYDNTVFRLFPSGGTISL